MKRKRWIGVGLLVALVLAAAVLSPGVLESATREINEAILQGRKWIFSTAAAGGSAHGQRIEVTAQNGVVTPLVLQTKPSTAAVGDGVSLNYEAHNNLGVRLVGAQLWAVTTDVTSGSEDAYMEFITTAAGAGSGRMRLDDTGLKLTAGSQIGLEGPTGDTYLRRDPDGGSLDTYKDGALNTQQRTNEWIPVECDADGPDTFGGICRNVVTGHLCGRDAAGLFSLRGGGPC